MYNNFFAKYNIKSKFKRNRYRRTDFHNFENKVKKKLESNIWHTLNKFPISGKENTKIYLKFNLSILNLITS